MDIVIRKMTIEDLQIYSAVIKNLILECFENRTDTEMKIATQKLSDLATHIKIGDSYTHIAIVNNNIVGILYLYPLPSEDKMVLHIAYISVDVNHRKMGIGKKLLEKACDIACELDIRIIELFVNENNGAAYKLYKSAGFETYKKLMRLETSYKR